MIDLPVFPKDALDLVSTMVRFDSQTQTSGESELARYLVERMKRSGLDARLQEVSPGRYNAIGVLRGSGDGESLLYNGHIDTNPATEGWTVDPWGGLVADGFIYGLGVSNMKAGCASYLAAVETLCRHGLRPRGDVILTFVVGELQGGVGTLRAIEEGVRADHFVNCEPTDLTALTLHAGALNFVIELVGITRHLSKREDSVDAIAAACELVPQVNAMTFTGAAGPEHRSVNRANIGVFRGALSRDLVEWRPPQVADVARLIGTARFAPSQTEESVLADLRALGDGLASRFPGLRVTVRKEQEDTGLPDFPPFEVPRESRIVSVVNDAYHAVRGHQQETGAVRPYAFYGSDAAHLLGKTGMTGVVCGPGGKYNTMPNERVDVTDYLDAIRLHMRTIATICGLEPAGDR